MRIHRSDFRPTSNVPIKGVKQILSNIGRARYGSNHKTVFDPIRKSHLSSNLNTLTTY